MSKFTYLLLVIPVFCIGCNSTKVQVLEKKGSIDKSHSEKENLSFSINSTELIESERPILIPLPPRIIEKMGNISF